MRAGPTLLALGAIASLAIVAFDAPAPILVWNATASAPQGLYFVIDRAPLLGDFVLVTPSADVVILNDDRAYLPADTPLIKRVAALSGEEICREGERISINGAVVAAALAIDSQGRAMPRWEACFALGDGEIFLLNDHPKSLDGRYFGATRADDVQGVAKLIWKRNGPG